MHPMNIRNQSVCHSPLPSRESLTTTQRYTLAVSYTLMTPLTLFLNGFLIFALFQTKQHKHTFARFILALCISDFCIGAIVQPTATYMLLAKEDCYENCAASWFFTFIAYVFLNFSGLSIFMVSVDRFLRLRKSKLYLQYASMKSVNISIIMAALFSVVIAIGCVLSAYYYVFCYYNMVVISINGLAAGGILFFYFLTWRNVRKQISSIKTLTPPDKRHCSESQLTLNACEKDEDNHSLQLPRKISKISILSKSKLNLGLKKQRRSYDASMTRTVAAILICCCVTYPPYFMVTFKRSLALAIEGRCDQKSDDYILAFFATFFLMFVNSTANAVLYSCNNRQVKKLILKLLTRRKNHGYIKKSSVKKFSQVMLTPEKSNVSAITVL